jgi:hypothetical protein
MSTANTNTKQVKLTRFQVKRLRSSLYRKLNKGTKTSEIDDDMFKSLRDMLTSKDNKDIKLAKHIIMDGKFKAAHINYMIKHIPYVIHDHFGTVEFVMPTK